MKHLIVVGFVLALAAPGHAQITGRSVPLPVYGITLDRVDRLNSRLNAIANIIKTPTVRVVFDPGVNPSDYAGPIQKLRSVGYVMGLLADSSAMADYTVSSITTMTKNYTTALGSSVDIWEIGNEINGDWLGSNVFAKMAAMYNSVADKGGKTALTFFYEGEVGQRNCIDSQGGMFPWIKRYFQDAPTAQSEKIRLGLNYALISWYPTQCRGVNPNWPVVFSKLAGIFPNAKVGFGEVGTPRPQNGSDTEKQLISTFYPLAKTIAGLPASYIGGVFWWYSYQELTQSWFLPTLNAALSAGP